MEPRTSGSSPACGWHRRDSPRNLIIWSLPFGFTFLDGCHPGACSLSPAAEPLGFLEQVGESLEGLEQVVPVCTWLFRVPVSAHLERGPSGNRREVSPGASSVLRDAPPCQEQETELHALPKKGLSWPEAGSWACATTDQGQRGAQWWAPLSPALLLGDSASRLHPHLKCACQPPALWASASAAWRGGRHTSGPAGARKPVKAEL